MSDNDNGNGQAASRLILPNNDRVIDLQMKQDLVGGLQVQYNPNAAVVRVMPVEALGIVPIMLEAPGQGPIMAYAMTKPEVLVQLLGAQINLIDALVRQALDLQQQLLDLRNDRIKDQLAKATAAETEAAEAADADAGA